MAPGPRSAAGTRVPRGPGVLPPPPAALEPWAARYIPARMRFTGTLKSWNDERGFGFIEPTQGGQEIFVHIKAFPSGTGRPVPGQSLTFEIEPGPDGKKRAKAVQYPVKAGSRPRPRVEGPAPWTPARVLVVPAFLAAYGFVVVRWGFHPLVPLVYIGASLVAVLVYAFDKAAAVGGHRRTPEGVLHAIALGCGWPGALLAQQLLRHKTSKAEFIHVFWATVLINTAGMVFWHAGIRTLA